MYLASISQLLHYIHQKTFETKPMHVGVRPITPRLIAYDGSGTAAVGWTRSKSCRPEYPIKTMFLLVQYLLRSRSNNRME
jgi:hypothetical protein